MQKSYEVCQCCPRKCQVNRQNQYGVCHSSEHLKIARAALHFEEEPSISGQHGSGAIFFCGCNLNCVYCQNKEISQNGKGKEISVERLAQIMLELQEKKAHNINLVTPTHFMPSIKEAIKLAKKQGLHIPIIYNTSGYEEVEMLKQLEGLIDIYLTDFKYYEEKWSKALSHCSNYQEIARNALEEMYRQTGENQFDEDGMMIKGVLVRHLCLPTLKEDSKKILAYLYHHYQDHIYLSIMNQYTPMEENKEYPFLNQTLKEEDYEEIIDYALDIGIKKAYMQESDASGKCHIPEFNLEGIEKEL